MAPRLTGRSSAARGRVRRAAIVTVTVAGVLLATTPAIADKADEPRVVQIVPGREGEMVVCRLRNRGLPGPRLLQSMRSGLVSAVDFSFTLHDEQTHVIHEHGLSLRLAFDVWEEIFSVGDGQYTRRFADLSALQGFLADLPGLPVAPMAALDDGRRFRVRVGMQLQAIAPSERGRVEQLIAGDSTPARLGDDEQEVSVSLGRLIRFFYKGTADRPQRSNEVVSPWFLREELVDATD